MANVYSFLSDDQWKGLKGQTWEQMIQAYDNVPKDLYPGFPELDTQLPGLGNIQNMSLAGLEKLLGEWDESGGGVTGDLREGTLQGFLRNEPDYDSVDRLFQSNVKAPALKEFDEILARTSRELAGNTYGKDLRDADIASRGDLMQFLTQAKGGMVESERQNTASNALKATQIAGSETEGLGKLLGLGAPQAAQLMRQWETSRNEMMRRIQEAKSRFDFMAAQYGAQTQGALPASPEQPGMAGNLLNAGGNILAALFGPAGDSMGNKIDDWIFG